MGSTNGSRKRRNAGNNSGAANVNVKGEPEPPKSAAPLKKPIAKHSKSSSRQDLGHRVDAGNRNSGDGGTVTNATILTASQLRNARKRRAKQKQKKKQMGGQPNGDHNREDESHRQGSTTATTSSGTDPSALYIKNPAAAPIVQAAKKFFVDRVSQFPIYQNGPKEGWRMVSKLPVRAIPSKDKEGKTKNRVVIGMFQPKSHTVVTTTSKNKSVQYPAHHPSINKAMNSLAGACQEMDIAVYDEIAGTGYLRYVAMNVERATGKIQLTLIWNDKPYQQLEMGKEAANTTGNSSCSSSKKKRKRQQGNDNGNDLRQDDTGKFQLERLLAHLTRKQSHNNNDSINEKSTPTKIKTSSSTIQHIDWHSIWVHYNSAWKHSNAIFDIHADPTENAWQQIVGPKTIPERLTLPPTKSEMKSIKQATSPTASAPVTLHFAPNVFRQANLDAFAHIISSIRRRVHQMQGRKDQSSKRLDLVELYGGVGTIGLVSIQRVICCVHPSIRRCSSTVLCSCRPLIESVGFAQCEIVNMFR